MLQENIKKHKKRKIPQFALELIMIIVIVGVLAAIALPRYLPFQKRSRQTEAKTNLGSLHKSHWNYHRRFGVYAGTFVELNWKPEQEGKWRYEFLMSPDERLSALKIKFGVSADSFTAAAIGNIDWDSTLDIWTINQDGRL